MLLLFCFINALNYMDRGIVPGAYDKINDFILKTLPGADPDNLDGLRGLLTSAFIVSYAFAGLVFGHLVHVYPPFKLMAFGLFIWCIAVVICAIAPSYYVLIVGRALSGVGEASFQCVVPPFIDDNAGKEQRARWLAYFFSMIPCGTALGYAWAALWEGIGWQWAFGMEAPLMLPAAIVTFFLPYHAKAKPHDAHEEKEVAAFDPDPPKHPSPSVWQEFAVVLSSPIYLCSTFGYAGYTFAVAGFGAFGPQFLNDLGLIASKGQASIMFGALIAATGFIGTAAGGIFLDRMQLTDNARQQATLGILDSGHSLVSAVSIEGDDDLENTVHASLLSASDRRAVGAMEIGGPTDGPIRSAEVSAHDVAVVEAEEAEATKLRMLDIKLCASLREISFLTLGGMIFCVISPLAIDNLGLYFACLAVGTLMLFGATAGTNIAIMASVPAESRPFAIGLGTVITHAFGDVPSPFLIGLISDKLAPDNPGEPRSKSGLQLTLFLVGLWIGWAVILWSVAWFFARMRRRLHEKERAYEELGGAGIPIWTLF
jgi:MFS family permease